MMFTLDTRTLSEAQLFTLAVTIIDPPGLVEAHPALAIELAGVVKQEIESRQETPGKRGSYVVQVHPHESESADATMELARRAWLWTARTAAAFRVKGDLRPLADVFEAIGRDLVPELAERYANAAAGRAMLDGEPPPDRDTIQAGMRRGAKHIAQQLRRAHRQRNREDVIN